MGHRFTLQLVAKPVTPLGKGCDHHVFRGVCTRCGLDEYAIREAIMQASMKELQGNLAKALKVQGTITLTTSRDVTTGNLVLRSELKQQPPLKTDPGISPDPGHSPKQQYLSHLREKRRKGP